jgi:MFS family permease
MLTRFYPCATRRPPRSNPARGPRTFSLARLLLAISLFCILCGLTVNFPQDALTCALAAVVFGPMFFAWLAMLDYSSRPIVISIAFFVGAIIGFLFLPVALILSARLVGLPLTGWAGVLAIICVPISATVGSISTGGAFLMYELRHRRGES